MDASDPKRPGSIDTARRTMIDADRPIDAQRLARACAPAQVRRRGAARLHSTYFDTVGLALVSAGYSLRYRVSGTEASWTLSCPDGAEHRRPAPAGIDGMIPDDLRSLAGPALHHEPVTAFLAVNRVDTRFDIADPDGAPVAEVVEDTVEAVHLLTGGSVGCWRRVQVSLAPDADEALVRLIEHHVRAGA